MRLITLLLALTIEIHARLDKTQSTDTDGRVVMDREQTYGDLYMVYVQEVADTEHPEAKNVLRPTRRRLPMWRELKFTAHGPVGETYHVELQLERSQVWARDAKSDLQSDEVIHERTYRGSGDMTKCIQEECEYFGEIHLASVGFYREPDFKEHTFHAVLHMRTVQWIVEPTMFVKKNEYKNGNQLPKLDSALGFAEPEMYMFRSSEVFTKHEDEFGHTHYKAQRRLLQSGLITFDNCFQGQGEALKTISLGMLADNGFIAVAGGSSGYQTYIVNMMNDVNAMYNAQMKVEFRLKDIRVAPSSIPNEGPTTPGTKTCPSQQSASTRLASLRNWRRLNEPNTYGLWHLMTHCHPPSGTVGVAYVGALCYSFGVGLSNWLGSSTWEVVAHELGHNFGSGHTFDFGLTGGIMDYGDGTLNGIHQFHPIHRNEVCEEISASQTQQRTITDCWSTEGLDTPTDLGEVYVWRRLQTPEYTDCTCDGVRQEKVACVRVNLDAAGCNVGDIDSCPTGSENLANCDIEIMRTSSGDIDESLCNPSCKPGPYTGSCSAPSSCPSSNTDYTPDAALVDQDGRLWLFMGPKYVVYQTPTSTQPLTNPKLLSNIAQLNSNYHDGIDAVVSFYDNYALLIKGERLVVFDLDAVAQVGTTEYNVENTFWGGQFSDEFEACATKVDAAIAYQRTIDFMCGNYVSTFRWSSYTMGSVQLIDQKYSRSTLNWPAGNGQGIAAATRDPTNGEIKLYKQNQIATVYPSGDVTYVTLGSLQAVLGSEASSSVVGCAADNCQSCSNNGATCTECEDGYILHGGGMCRPEAAFMMVTFDDDSEYDSFADSISTTIEGGFTVDTIQQVEGAFGNGGYLNGQQMLRMDPVEFGDLSNEAGGEGLVYDWKISFYWKPSCSTTVPGTTDVQICGRMKFLTLNRDFGGYTREFAIYFTDVSETEPVDEDRLAIEIDMYGEFMDCYVERPIAYDQWNKITISFHNGELITSSNGMYHRVAMEGVEGTDDLGVMFDDWYIGASVAGLEGSIDNIEVSRIDNHESNAKPLGFYVGVGFALAFILMCPCLVYYWFCYRKQKDDVDGKIDSKLTDRALEMSSKGNTTSKGQSSGSPSAELISANGDDDEEYKQEDVPTPPTSKPPPIPVSKPPPRPPAAGGKKKRAPPRRGKKKGPGGPPPPPPNAAAKERRGSWAI